MARCQTDSQGFWNLMGVHRRPHARPSCSIDLVI